MPMNSYFTYLMAITILAHNFSNFNVMNIFFMVINGHGKRFDGHYFVNGH